MTSYIKFTALSGARNEDPLCYLLELDEARILLDCGWTESFNTEDLRLLKRYAKTVDCVLLSHNDLSHLGALPYAISKLGLSCPIYATFPIQSLGRMSMIDALVAKRRNVEYEEFSIDDIETAFSRISQLKYMQPYNLSGKCKGVQITAYSAGHTVGGTIWKLKKDTDEIVYAVDFNHKKERHLNASTLFVNGQVHDALSRPTVMITDAYSALSSHPTRKKRDVDLMDTIMDTLRGAGNVLLPTDSASRVLELTYVLEQYWSAQKLSYPIVFLSCTSQKTIQYAKSMLEWLGESLTKAFSNSREYPFNFKNIKLVQNLDELADIENPKVVITTCPSLESGFSRDLFIDWCSNPKNTVLFTLRAPPNSLARHLYDEYLQRCQSNGAPDSKSDSVGLHLDLEIPMRIHKKAPLEGVELTEHLRKEREKEEREHAQAALLAKSRSIIDQDSDIESDTEETDDIEVEQLLSTHFDLYLKDSARSGGFFKQTQSFKMFPYVEQRKRFDDYGEVIKPEMFVIEYEQMQPLLNGKTKKKGQEEDDMDLDLPEQGIFEEEDAVPSKYVTEELVLQVKCLIKFIDFEGLSDGRSLKTIIPQIAPRKLILIHGSEEATEDMTISMDLIEFGGDVLAPPVGETVNVSTASNIYQVKLTDSLMSSMEISKLEDYEVAYVTGKIHIPADSTLPVLDAVPVEDQSRRDTIFVGDVKLTDFKRVLEKEGYKTEFMSGMLIVNGLVGVRKAPTGQLIVEGSLSDNFYHIRSLLYNQLAIL